MPGGGAAMPEMAAGQPTADAAANAGAPAAPAGASAAAPAAVQGASSSNGGSSTGAGSVGSSARSSAAPSSNASGRSAQSNAPQGSAAAPTQAPGVPAPTPGPGAPKGSLGASDVGVTADSINLGSISSQSASMSRYIAGPVTKAALAVIASINDNGGVLGRKLHLTDCDDAADISRFRACYNKLVHEQKVFSLITSMTFGSGEVHGDLARDRLPWIGDIGWYGSSWTDPWMVPMYMAAVNDASAVADWIVHSVHAKNVGILYLNTPEMKLARDEMARVLTANGIKVGLSLSQELDTADESSNVLQMRSAGVDHIAHFSWPPPVAKFLIDAAQQGYWPEKGVSGNHMVIEAIPGIVGSWPLNRWWSSSGYHVWGSEYEAITKKYASNLSTLHHHNTQTAYIALRLLKQAAEEVGPNLTRDALMKQFESHPWDAGPDLGTTFTWKPNAHDTMKCVYMFKYASTDEGSFKVWQPVPDQFKSCGSYPEKPLTAQR
jgi:ABC-type branched-subunit amino acid transport system substrate-binding protein